MTTKKPKVSKKEPDYRLTKKTTVNNNKLSKKKPTKVKNIDPTKKKYSKEDQALLDIFDLSGEWKAPSIKKKANEKKDKAVKKRKLTKKQQTQVYHSIFDTEDNHSVGQIVLFVLGVLGMIGLVAYAAAQRLTGV